MKRSMSSRITTRARYITPGEYRIKGTGRRVYITKSGVRRVYRRVYITKSDKKIATKEVKPGIFELQYAPSEEIYNAVKAA